MEPLYIVVAAGVVVIIYIVALYNGLQSLLTHIEAATQEIGNQLKRQASLIPNLESSVKAFMKQEKEVFTLLSQARQAVEKASKSGSGAAIDAAQDELNAVLPRLQVVVEDNPELKSNETVQQFMAELRDTADKLSYSRRAVIDLSQQYNMKLVVFPSNIIASIFGFKKQAGIATPMKGAHMEVSEDETHDHKVSL
jgi:LemA protein